MLKDQFIICDSNIPWHHNRYSKHHLMSRLARHNDVVFVNPQIDALRYAGEHGWGQTRFGARFSYPEGESLEVFQSLAVPRRGSAQALLKLDQRYLCRQLRGIIRRHGGRPPILFIGNPWNVFLLDAFPESPCTIYHCSDDFPALFRGNLGRQIAEREARLVPRVDLVLCSHPRLVEKCQRLGGNVHYLQHGVDERLLLPSDDHRPEPPPIDIKDLSRPLVGFVGSLDATVDFELLGEVVRLVPELQFVLIGQSDDEHMAAVQTLVEQPNVHWLGQKPWNELSGYLWSFDVALIPFAQTEFTAAGSPLKLFEYLAAGLPVVSTRLHFDDALLPLVRIGETPTEFAEQVTCAAKDTNIKGRRWERRSAVAAQYTWDRRAQELLDLVARKLASGREGASDETR